LSSPWSERPGAFFLAQRQNPGEFADKLDRRLPILRHEPDRLDCRPQYLGRFRPQLLLVERLRQLLDLAPVDLGEAGMQPRRRRLDILQLTLELEPPSLELFELSGQTLGRLSVRQRGAGYIRRQTRGIAAAQAGR
jgi:hypothetical protein